MNFDVIIVGGGIAGASLGAEIAGQRRTLIVEAEDHCGYHSTGRSAAFFLESYGGAKVAQLTLRPDAFSISRPRIFPSAGFLHRRGALHHFATTIGPKLPAESVTARRIERAELDALVPGFAPHWTKALFEPGCADIDVAALHAAFLRQFSRAGGEVRADRALAARRRSAASAGRSSSRTASNSGRAILVDAAGAWADRVAEACGVGRSVSQPKRRTMVQLRVGTVGLKDLPLIDDAAGTFYFKGEGDRTVWLSPHDEIATDPCDAAPEEIDIATAIDRFEAAVDWPVERVERSWAGLRTLRARPAAGLRIRLRVAGLLLVRRAGRVRHPDLAGRGKARGRVAAWRAPDSMVAHIDPATSRRRGSTGN